MCVFLALLGAQGVFGSKSQLSLNVLTSYHAQVLACKSFMEQTNFVLVYFMLYYFSVSYLVIQRSTQGKNVLIKVYQVTVTCSS